MCLTYIYTQYFQVVGQHYYYYYYDYHYCYYYHPHRRPSSWKRLMFCTSPCVVPLEKNKVVNLSVLKIHNQQPPVNPHRRSWS